MKDDGVLAITVPPGESLVIGGHLTNWNAGILLYNLVLAGFDCGDLRKITPYLPNVEYRSNDRDDNFKGNIYSLNW